MCQPYRSRLHRRKVHDERVGMPQRLGRSKRSNYRTRRTGKGADRLSTGRHQETAHLSLTLEVSRNKTEAACRDGTLVFIDKEIDRWIRNRTRTVEPETRPGPTPTSLP